MNVKEPESKGEVNWESFLENIMVDRLMQYGFVLMVIVFVTEILFESRLICIISMLIFLLIAANDPYMVPLKEEGID